MNNPTPIPEDRRYEIEEEANREALQKIQQSIDESKGYLAQQRAEIEAEEMRQYLFEEEMVPFFFLVNEILLPFSFFFHVLYVFFFGSYNTNLIRSRFFYFFFFTLLTIL